MLTKKIQAGIIPAANYKQPAAVANGTAPSVAPAAAANAPMDEAEDEEEEELEDNPPVVASSKAVEAAEPAAEKSSAGVPSAPPVASVDAAAVSAPGTEATVEELPAAISAMEVEDGREREAGRREGDGSGGSGNGEAAGGGQSDAMDDEEGEAEAATGEDEVETVPEVEMATAETGKEEGVEKQDDGGGDGGAETGAGRTALVSASDIKKYKVSTGLPRHQRCNGGLKNTGGRVLHALKDCRGLTRYPPYSCITGETCSIVSDGLRTRYRHDCILWVLNRVRGCAARSYPGLWWCSVTHRMVNYVAKLGLLWCQVYPLWKVGVAGCRHCLNSTCSWLFYLHPYSVQLQVLGLGSCGVNITDKPKN